MVQTSSILLKYGRFCGPEKRGSTIGGCESAWLADLVASYAIENLDDLVWKTKVFVESINTIYQIVLKINGLQRTLPVIEKISVWN